MAKDTTTTSRTLTYVDGVWQDGNPQVLGPRSHAVWLGSAVFDGARAIQGRVPDLDRHCAVATFLDNFYHQIDGFWQAFTATLHRP